MSTYDAWHTAHGGPLLVGRSVANAPTYKGKRNPPSEATLAKRAAEARLAARGTCGSCFTKFTPAGTCSC